MQDLQHQISTKTLALQTLQREHDQLLAAFSRSQIRCSALEKKSQVSDHEINALAEEKIRLQQQLERIETQVENLTQSRDEAQRQSAADSAQWRQIMAMSSQLQAKGAEETRQYKQDREMWEKDREDLLQRLRQLESSQAKQTSPHSPNFQHLKRIENGGPVPSRVEELQAELLHLRQRCEESERRLVDVAGIGDQMDRIISAMSEMRQKLTFQS